MDEKNMLKKLKRVLNPDLKKHQDKKPHKVLSIYLKGDTIKAVNVLKENDVNVSLVCRFAIEDMAKQVLQEKEK